MNRIQNFNTCIIIFLNKLNRGPSVLVGYVDNSQANADSFFEGGWFRTGDLGFVTSSPVFEEHEGGKRYDASLWKYPSSKTAGPWLTLTGRKKELINRGGEKVSPAEVEAVATEEKDIKMSVCFPMPDAVYGEQVALAVVPQVDNGKKTISKVKIQI